MAMKLWQLGLVIFVTGGAVKAILMNVGVGGILRELTRLTVITGLVLVVVGLVRRK